MNQLSIDRFDEYFQALHGCDPYPWQHRLAKQAIAGHWPGAIDLPTGSGKTACIDIAIFALACQASLPVEQHAAPRRIFFCVNRRVIVDEAHTRASHIAQMLWEAEQKQPANRILRNVTAALRTVAGTSPNDGAPPLDVVELRGGIYRDNRWARSITQPTIVCTTLDQLGSRLLFRGYGVSTNAAPIQAAMIAYDSLILLDEAHISEPFCQSLDHVRRYLDPQKWAEQSIGVRPVCVVPMTATPNDKRGVVIQLDAADRRNESLNRRLTASKSAELCITKDVVKEAVSIAKPLDSDKPVAVGIIVNRVATAKAIYYLLCGLKQQAKEQSKSKKRKIDPDAVIELVIGSMRPIDRDTQAERLRSLVGPERPAITGQTSFVVATQCLEVGADYDFDVLITECASLDALCQRFGRLNRAGRPIKAEASILINKKDIKPNDKLDDDKPLDPIYGNALARTWNWLTGHAVDDHIDFGIDAFSKTLAEKGEEGRLPQDLLPPSASLNAPVMLPAYIDFWCQTAPRPVPDPDVSLFIHGPQCGEPDVQVCWRADLIEDNRMGREHWPDVVALLPPTSAECMSVPISRVRRWLADQTDSKQDHGDVLELGQADQGKARNKDDALPASLRHPGVLWRGAKDSTLIQRPDDLRPGDTLVLPASDGNSRALGHLPDVDHAEPAVAGESNQQPPAVNDVAEIAFARARDLAVLRLHPHPSLRARLPVGEAFDDLFTAAAERGEPPSPKEWKDKLGAAAAAIPNDENPLKKSLLHLAGSSIHIEPYPDQRGLVLATRRRLGTSMAWFIRPMDDGDDESSRIRRDVPIVLADHSKHVADVTTQTLRVLPVGSLAKAYELVATLHDLGKADERFQAMLRRTDRTDAWLLASATSAVLAKSDGMAMTHTQRAAARRRAGLPDGFRHEMLSVQLAEYMVEHMGRNLGDNANQRDIILHLVAAHHGHARPFAPVVMDDELPPIDVENITLSHEQRAQFIPAHRLDSGVAERFWSLTRRFGWWGLAYLEAVLRLADQQASAAEEAGKYDKMSKPMETTK